MRHDEDPPGTLGSFLLPHGFRRPAVREVVREASVVAEAVRYAALHRAERRA